MVFVTLDYYCLMYRNEYLKRMNLHGSLKGTCLIKTVIKVKANRLLLTAIISLEGL